MKFLYYLAAFGSPNFDAKLYYLKNNLEYIYSNIGENFDIIINNYDVKQEDFIYSFLNNFKFLNKKYIFSKEGHLSELWLSNKYNSKIKNYDYVMFILDDICEFNIDIKDMIKIKNQYKFEILSPKIYNSTYDWMKNNNDITVNNFLEIFCFLLTPFDFYNFILLNTIENKYIWGIDHIFGYLNMKVGMYNKYSVKHMITSINTNNIQEKFDLCNKYLQNHGFKDLNDIRVKYNPVVEYIKHLD
jgi:hypothetical protein